MGLFLVLGLLLSVVIIFELVCSQLLAKHTIIIIIYV